jgi:hypothetical protein
MTAPVLDRPTVPQVLERVYGFMRGRNWNGGVLHVVLGDGNLHRKDIDRCRQEALSQNPPNLEAVALCDELSKLTMSQIRRLYRRLWWAPPESVLR